MSSFLLPRTSFLRFALERSTCDRALLMASLFTDVTCSATVQSSPPKLAKRMKGTLTLVKMSTANINNQNHAHARLTIALVRWYATYCVWLSARLSDVWCIAVLVRVRAPNSPWVHSPHHNNGSRPSATLNELPIVQLYCRPQRFFVAGLLYRKEVPV